VSVTRDGSQLALVGCGWEGIGVLITVNGKLHYAISTIAASSGADAPTVFFLSRKLVTTDGTAAFSP